MSGRGEKKGNTNDIGQGNHTKDKAQRNRLLIKSNSYKSTRITLRSIKSAATTRPPWNGGTSPSPASSKASAAKRSARTLPRKFPIRGKLLTQEEYSSPQNTQQVPTLKATPPSPYSKTEPRKPTIPPKAESDLTWGYDIRKASLAVRIDPDTSDDEQTVPQVAVPPGSNMINKPSLGVRVQPDSQGGAWDQFAENERLFGLKTDYDENIYTMPLNRNDRQYKQKAAVADRIAREIELESPCHADGEPNEEEDVPKFRSKMNHSRQLQQPTSQSSIKSVKWDPAIIACGLKNIDRKAIRELLEALKNLDSDEDQATKPSQASKEEAKESHTGSNAVPGKGLNPRAPAFRERSSGDSMEDSQQEPFFLGVTRKRARIGETQKNDESELGPAAKIIKCWFCGYEMTSDALDCPRCEASRTPPPGAPPPPPPPPPRTPAFREQDPIWIDTCQLPPTIIDHEVDDFHEFCRTNNFIPLVPVSQIPIIPLTPTEMKSSLNTPYIDFKPDLIPMTYTLPFYGMESTLPIVQPPKIQALEDASRVRLSRSGNVSKQSYRAMATQDIICLLEETSEPIEDGHREAKALAPVWGAQILENFVKKYPMTGQRKPKDAIFKQKENQKSDALVEKTKCANFEGKSGEGNPSRRAAEVQQNLEMLLFQQREKGAPLVPAHKIKATEIQQKLEIMLYKLKEQKALESFSKLVLQRADGRCSDKSSDIELEASRSIS
ncbi:hypothetical protein BGZ57DRAFT_920431 [Hyaloscypha finlandica]|nr:hypothetical protein BGZ57DRAFT_920431 [Hyaloscypha finlandica]